MATATQTNERAVLADETCGWPTRDSVERTVRNARRVISEARQATGDFADGTADKVRQHPFASVGAAAVAGVVAGGVIGFAYAWLSRRRAGA